MYMFRGYDVLQWLIFFMTYSIGGWIFESVYCSLKEGKLLNRGFCHGPWLPLYGTGATLLVMLSVPYRSSHLLVFLTGMLGGTALELLTGVLLYHIFHLKWWDYTQNPLNFRGYICAGASLAWGVLALIIVNGIHPRVEGLSAHWTYTGFVIINTMLYTLLTEDIVLSICNALDLRDRLEELKRNSEEIERLRSGISEIYGRLNQLQEAVSETVQDARLVAETEGGLAAARLVSELVKENSASAVRTMADRGKTMARELRQSSAEAARNVARSSAAAARSAVRSGADAVVSTAEIAAAGGAEAVRSVAERSMETKQYLLERKRSMEQRLELLLNGGSEKRGHMDWWTGSMLRNNTVREGENENYRLLREAALRRKKKKDKEEQEKPEDSGSFSGN